MAFFGFADNYLVICVLCSPGNYVSRSFNNWLDNFLIYMFYRSVISFYLLNLVYKADKTKHRFCFFICADCWANIRSFQEHREKLELNKNGV